MEKVRINGDKNIVIQNNDGSEITLNIHDSEDMKRLFLEFRYVIYELSHVLCYLGAGEPCN